MSADWRPQQVRADREEPMGRWIRSMYMDLVDRREVDDNLYRVTIAANEKVRRPPDLEFAGLSTENYFKNPVVMWAHDSEGRSPSGGLPVARTVALSKGADGRLVADFEFLTDDPFAQRIKNAWDKGFLKAASISWLPVETAPDEGGQWRDTRSELLEWSIVPVPADPDALRRAKLRMTAESDPRAEEGAYGREGLSLSPHDLDDLREALFLMRGVLDEMEDRGGAPRGAPAEYARKGGQMGEMTVEELREIREAVESILSVVSNDEDEKEEN